MFIFNRFKVIIILVFVVYYIIFNDGVIGVLDECENVLRSILVVMLGVILLKIV